MLYVVFVRRLQISVCGNELNDPYYVDSAAEITIGVALVAVYYLPIYDYFWVLWPDLNFPTSAQQIKLADVP